MSDENTPKLRLRPKLAGGPPAITPTPVSPPAQALQPEDAIPEPVVIPPPEAKPNPLRAKLALKAEVPIQPTSPAVDEAISTPAKEAPTYSHDPREFPPPPAKQLLVPSRPKAGSNPLESEGGPTNAGATPPFPVSANKAKFPVMLDAPPPSRLSAASKIQETWPAVLNAPPPPGLATTVASGAAEEEPAEITAIRKASTFPFPSPTAKFPPLPGLSSSADALPAESSEQGGFLKKLLLIGALAIFLLAGAGFAYFKFFAKRSAKPAPSAQPLTTSELVADKTHTAADKTQSVQPAPATPVPATGPDPVAATPGTETAPVNSVPVPDAGVVSTIPVAPEPEIVPPVPVKPPPPQPSLAFKAWVINLRIRGVRGGDAQRVFIDKTSYVPGDVVNQQLGIMFTGYDESTRMLTFQDKTGAVFERRH